jgi:hypothetical protein
VSARARVFAYGSAGLCVIAGTVCAIVVEGVTGQALAIALLSIGLGGVVLLLFFEVGLSEDRDRAREEARRREREEARHRERASPRSRVRPTTPRWRRRP